MKSTFSPFIGTRGGKVGDIIRLAMERIGVSVSVVETNITKKAYEELVRVLRNGYPAIVNVDMAYLPYCVLPEAAHFGGHAIAVFGLDEVENEIYVYDRGKRLVTLSITDLETARGSRYRPYPAKNRMYSFGRSFHPKSPADGIIAGIVDCCSGMLHPPIRNIGLEGIKKWADMVVKWPDMFTDLSLYGCLMGTFTSIAIGGTGGSAFRTMYAKFMEEAASIVNKPELMEVAAIFREAGKLWDSIAVAALPDHRPVLKRIREIIMEKNRCFEEQVPGHMERMRELFEEE